MSQEVTFKLNDTTPTINLKASKLNSKALFDRVLNPKTSSYSSRAKTTKVRNIEYVSTTKSTGFDAQGLNGLLFTWTKSFADHLPLTIKPDDIMYTLSAGLATHIKLNAEKLKNYFSDQPDKYKIVVRRDEFVRGSATNDWMSVFDEFVITVGKTVLDKELITRMQQTFESSTRKSMTARNISIMEAMSPYCNYELQTMCGIPEITLKGSHEEWVRVRDFANYLRKYDLDWWIDVLDPVLEQFIQTALNARYNPDEIDTTFWNEMVKKIGGSGGPYFSGWVSTLFPYLTGYKGLDKNDFKKQFTSDMAPSGIATVDVMWDYLGKKIPLKVHAGMMCCTLNKKGSLKPKMLFCVEDCGPQLINDFEVGDTEVDGITITEDAKNAVMYGKFYYPAQLHYIYKYGSIDAVTVNCDLCKVKTITASVSYRDDYDLCLTCAGRVTTFMKERCPIKKSSYY